MANTTRLKPPAPAKMVITSEGSTSFLLQSLSDPSKYDEALARRLANALNVDDGLPTLKPSIKGKQKANKSRDNDEERRRLAMGAANAASQSLGTVVQSGWKASNTTIRAGFSKNGTLAIVQSFKVAILLLRNLVPRSIDVERVVLSFINKLMTAQMYETALELLTELKPNVVSLYNETSAETSLSKSPTLNSRKSQSLAQYFQLCWYPFPAPENTVLLGLISTSIVQAVSALAILLSQPPANDVILEAFASTIEQKDGIMAWYSFLPEDQANTALTRIHRVLAISFSSANTTPSILFRLRKWALQCLSCKITLDADSFWSQATSYLASHGKSVIKTEDSNKTIDDAVAYFEAIIIAAQRRLDSRTFMSGASFHKFCEIALVFAQRGTDVTKLKNIIAYIKNSEQKVPPSLKLEIPEVQLFTIFTQAVTLLNKYLNTGSDEGLTDTLGQCADALSTPTTVSSCLDPKSNALRSLEKIRRLCGRILEEGKGGKDLRTVVERFLEGFIRRAETLDQQFEKSMANDLAACAIDSLCLLAKAGLSINNPDSYTTAYESLNRGKVLVFALEAGNSSSKSDPDMVGVTLKVLRCLSGAFWNIAVTLYQDDKFAAAIRFLTQACELGAMGCEMAGKIENSCESGLAPIIDTWTSVRDHLPRRWELLGECYSKIGDQRHAYNALINSVKAYSFESICSLTRTLSPDQIAADPAYSRLASLVERITYIAVFSLFHIDEASLRQSLHTDKTQPEVAGLILEWQIAGLEENLWKPETRPVIEALFRDSLALYDVQFPIRRVRILLRWLEVAYRTDDVSFPSTDVTKEIDTLMSKPFDTSNDAGLSHFRKQYQAAAHMWIALHAHRRSGLKVNSSVTILRQATSANKLLNDIFPAPLSYTSIKSPKPSPKARMAEVTKMATRSSPRKKVTIGKPVPVTPKPRKKAVPTPPRPPRLGPSPKSISIKSETFAVDVHLAKTVDMLAQLLGLLGHILLRIQFLGILQRMAEYSPEPSADAFVRASVAAAAEYIRLGKSQRGLAIYAHALAAIDNSSSVPVSDEVRLSLLLRYAEGLALKGSINKSVRMYEEARTLARSVGSTQLRTTAGRILARVEVLERFALASKVFALIQATKDGPHAALSPLRQSLRLWNRAFDSLSRLVPVHERADPNPFDMSSLATALPDEQATNVEKGKPSAHRTYRRNAMVDNLQWRIAEGLLYTLFELAHTYFQQGSVRGTEYFVDQAHDLATSLNSPVMISRALARKGEVQLHQGKIQDAAKNIMEAAEVLSDLPGVDAANVTRLRARYNQSLHQDSEAKSLYVEAISMVSELETALSTIDNALPGPRKSFLLSPERANDIDVLAPEFLAMVLRQQIWLHRNEPRATTKKLLEKLSALPPSRETKVEELAILAKLALHDVHVQFRADLFLSSLTESTIAIPMGLTSQNARSLSSGTKHMLETLSAAEAMFWANLECAWNRGQALSAREAAVSLALIRSFQTSLGKDSRTDARVAVQLLDASAAITLRHELIDAIEQKFPEISMDDLTWPCISDNPPAKLRTNADEDGMVDLKAYWNVVRSRYSLSHGLNTAMSTSRIDDLPANWTVVTISITEDKSTMLLSRQRASNEPLLFCVPLERHGRKEKDIDEQFTFDNAKSQLQEILQESDQTAKDAKEVATDDREAKASWWAKRVALDRRIKELLNNIEFCWLGAFKTILNEPVKTPPDILNNLRTRFEKVFHRALGSAKKFVSRLKLEDALIECFASLSPSCHDEELEDLVYFILDLYQFHGIHIELSEIDIDVLTVELRTALEEHATKVKGRITPVKDAHLFLVLDKNVQGIPWESTPVLRGKSVSRIPSLSFLVDRLEFSKIQHQTLGLPADGSPFDRAIVDPRKTCCVLNPSGDLIKSQDRFASWVKEMGNHAVGWQCIVGRVPSEQELLDALSKKDLVIYIGHGGAEQYVRSTKIKHLPRCAATMLWGCSSGLMRDMGDYDRTGTPYNYMMAGCPSLVACLWDVTDNELDKFSQSVFNKLRLDASGLKSWTARGTESDGMSVVTAVAHSRDVCKLKYLTGAAPVVYGIPFYL